MEKSITINGKSKDLYDNYSRQLAHLALHYSQFPLGLTASQVTDYLYFLKDQKDVSEAFFTFTVYAMRYACKMRGLSYEQFELPCIKHSKKLPVILNDAEVKRLLSSHKIINRKLVIALL